MGCKFCASGLNKKKRNLETNEIVLQVLITNIFLKKKFNEEIKNIVVMGIGEPFDNYENLNHFLNIAKSHYCINIGETHITVSTCGLVEKIIKFAYDQPKINLAISLHAPCDIIRKKIMPIDKIYNFSALIKGIEKYQEINKKPITIEYLLLKGINDKKENAEELIKNLSNIQYYVNLIPYNKNKEFLFERSDNISEFSKIIKDFGIKTTIRLERGKMINASCGQLRNNYEFKI
jgi:23S rRNA (adenine2503-C2)-methyltransferase